MRTLGSLIRSSGIDPEEISEDIYVPADRVRRWAYDEAIPSEYESEKLARVLGVPVGRVSDAIRNTRRARRSVYDDYCDDYDYDDGYGDGY